MAALIFKWTPRFCLTRPIAQGRKEQRMGVQCKISLLGAWIPHGAERSHLGWAPAEDTSHHWPVLQAPGRCTLGETASWPPSGLLLTPLSSSFHWMIRLLWAAGTGPIPKVDLLPHMPIPCTRDFQLLPSDWIVRQTTVLKWHPYADI